jgi:hypothetical protein
VFFALGLPWLIRPAVAQRAAVENATAWTCGSGLICNGSEITLDPHGQPEQDTVLIISFDANTPAYSPLGAVTPVFVNTPLSTDGAKFGNAAHFKDNTNPISYYPLTYVDVRDGALMNAIFASVPWTIECFWRNESLGNQPTSHGESIFAISTANTALLLTYDVFGSCPNNLQINYSIDCNNWLGPTHCATVTPTNGSKHHIAFVSRDAANGSVWKVFFDGQEVFVANNGASTICTTDLDGLHFGISSALTQHAMRGVLDECRITQAQTYTNSFGIANVPSIPFATVTNSPIAQGPWVSCYGSDTINGFNLTTTCTENADADFRWAANGGAVSGWLDSMALVNNAISGTAVTDEEQCAKVDMRINSSGGNCTLPLPNNYLAVSNATGADGGGKRGKLFEHLGVKGILK